MALLVRIDVDRPYGKHPLFRHLLSRFSSDAYLPRLQAFGYLKELELMLRMLNECKACAYVFFRRCTLPSTPVLRLLEQGGHEIGLHLENSRSYETFLQEKHELERHTGKPVRAFSKHGSGGGKYGWRHYAPYEPDKYLDWAQRSGMRLFLGNQEDPTLGPVNGARDFVVYPAAFWLEPHWRDTRRYPVDWLLSQGRQRDLVLLVHPENVMESPELVEQFQRIIANLESKKINWTDQ